MWEFLYTDRWIIGAAPRRRSFYGPIQVTFRRVPRMAMAGHLWCATPSMNGSRPG